MMKSLLVSCASAVVLVACNSGHVILGPESHRGGGNGYPYPESPAQLNLHPLPELQDPVYDRYQQREMFDGSGFVESGTTAVLDVWFMPRVAGNPVIRRFSMHDGYSGADETTTQGYCSFRLEYEVTGENECGEQKLCTQLALKVTHVMPSAPFPGEPCGEQPEANIEVVEDFNGQTLTYGPDLLPKNPSFLPETQTAWRRSVSPRWSPVAKVGAPPALRQANAYPVGDRVLVFGTSASGGFRGGWYKPSAEEWAALPTENAPVFDRFGAWAWVGDRLLVVTSGKAKWLKGNAWVDAPVQGLPDYTASGSPGCIRMAATDKEVLIWGSELVEDAPVSKGAVFDLEANAWRAVTPTDAPNSRCYMDIHASGGEFVVTGSDGTQSLFYPQASGLWANVPDVTDSNATILDTFMWGDRHTVVYRDNSHDWATGSLDTTSIEWTVRKESYRYSMGWTNIGGKPVLFGGLHEDWRTDDSELVMIDDGMMTYGEEAGREPLVFPKTDLLGPRVKPVVAYVQPDMLLVWGGCVRFVNGQCATYSDTGAVLKATLGR